MLSLFLALSPLNRFGFSPEFPLPIQVVLSFLLTQTDRFVRTYKRNSPFDKVLCAIKAIIKSAIRQRRIRQFLSAIALCEGGLHFTL